MYAIRSYYATILNNIFNEWIMETGDISDKIKRGKHTTRHAQLIELEDGGYVVDSPGFSSFELDDLHHSELEKHYPEFNKYIGECRFNGSITSYNVCYTKLLRLLLTQMFL